MKTFKAKGISPDEAFNNYPGFTLWLNTTREFHKSGLTLEEFANESAEQLELPEGTGCYVIIRKAKDKPAKQKFKVDNFITKGARRWVTMVNFLDAEGKTLERASTKDMPKAKAIARAKELSVKNISTISIVLSKEIVGGVDIIAEVRVKEDDSLGEYFFYGIEKALESTDD